MKTNVRLGRFFGIEIGLHYSWFLIAFLITTSLSGEFQHSHADWGSAVIWTTALMTALLFFAALLAHEMSHALVARARGLSTRAITLFALGGVAQIEKEPEDPKTEFLVGIVGPFTSAVIGVLSLSLAWILGWTVGAETATPTLAMLVWLGYINLMLAAFNMIPGFPLDGGRILHSIIWWSTGNGDRSTKAAARIGQLVALGFIALGIFRFLNGAGFGGLWISFIGWFLLQAAGASYSTVVVNAGLRNLRVADVMTRDCPVVDGYLSLSEFTESYLNHSPDRCFLVQQNGELAGMITPLEVSSVPQQRWPFTTLHDVMRPLDESQTVSPATPVMEALQSMTHQQVNQLPVFADHRFAGIITRANVLRYLQTRAAA